MRDRRRVRWEAEIMGKTMKNTLRDKIFHFHRQLSNELMETSYHVLIFIFSIPLTTWPLIRENNNSIWKTVCEWIINRNKWKLILIFFPLIRFFLPHFYYFSTGKIKNFGERFLAGIFFYLIGTLVVIWHEEDTEIQPIRKGWLRNTLSLRILKNLGIFPLQFSYFCYSIIRGWGNQKT